MFGSSKQLDQKQKDHTYRSSTAQAPMELFTTMLQLWHQVMRMQSHSRDGESIPDKEKIKRAQGDTPRKLFCLHMFLFQ